MAILNESAALILGEFNATLGEFSGIPVIGVLLFFAVMGFLATRSASAELFALIAVGLVWVLVSVGFVPLFVGGIVALIIGAGIAFGFNRLLNR